jgi:hypothetical protein
MVRSLPEATPAVTHDLLAELAEIREHMAPLATPAAALETARTRKGAQLHVFGVSR